MNKLAPHQERVVVERDELQTKIVALDKFIKSDTIKIVDGLEQLRLIAQLDAMNTYLKILNDRIAAF